MVNRSNRFNKGNVPYELNIQHYSSIVSFGEVDILKKMNATKITFQEISTQRGIISNYINFI